MSTLTILHAPPAATVHAATGTAAAAVPDAPPAAAATAATGPPSADPRRARRRPGGPVSRAAGWCRTPTSTTPRARPVWSRCSAAVAAALPAYSSVHRGAGYASQLTTARYERARHTVRAFAGARPDDAVVFTRNTTDAINLLARCLPEGTTVVVFDTEHHASLLPWPRAVRLAPPAFPGEAVRAGRRGARRDRRAQAARRHRRLQRHRRAVADRRAGPHRAPARRPHRGGRRAARPAPAARPGRARPRLRGLLRAQAVRAVRRGRAGRPAGLARRRPSRTCAGGGATRGPSPTRRGVARRPRAAARGGHPERARRDRARRRVRGPDRHRLDPLVARGGAAHRPAARRPGRDPGRAGAVAVGPGPPARGHRVVRRRRAPRPRGRRGAVRPSTASACATASSAPTRSCGTCSATADGGCATAPPPRSAPRSASAPPRSTSTGSIDGAPRHRAPLTPPRPGRAPASIPGTAARPETPRKKSTKGNKATGQTNSASGVTRMTLTEFRKPLTRIQIFPTV